MSNNFYTHFNNLLANCRVISKKDIHFTQIQGIINPQKDIPQEIQDYIRKNIHQGFEFKTIQDNINYTIQFFIETNKFSEIIYKDNVVKILTWLKIIKQLCPHSCNNRNLKVCIYMTKLKKILPINKNIPFDEIHINTGYTMTCPLAEKDNEIVIYRKEEWFKVFIHETIHNMSLDFSDMSTQELEPIHSKILRIFKINSKVNLYEAYTECWARIIHSLFQAQGSLSQLNFILNKEQTFMNNQCSKILYFYGVKYSDLLLGNANAVYKENTNVFSYYFLTYIFFINRDDFINHGLCFPKNPGKRKRELNHLLYLIKDNYLELVFKKKDNTASMKMTLFG
jgi:hypothetical protein